MITAEQFLSGLGITPETVVFNEDSNEYQYYFYQDDTLICCVLKEIDGVSWLYCVPYIPEKGYIDLWNVLIKLEVMGDFSEKTMVNALTSLGCKVKEDVR